MSNGIKYNHLNLPTEVKFNNSNSQVIRYTYAADGTKLWKQVPGKITDYAGNYIYGGTLQFFSHPEGYVSYENGQFKYVYNYTDHLGNVRLTYADTDLNGAIEPNTEILSENSYYPFGLEHKGYNNVVSSNANSTAEKFKYNGKELEEELGKDTYAYGWRDYDPAIGRFNKIDRFAEKYYNLSTYSYAGNNPIIFVDVQGDSISAGSQKKFDRLQRKADRINGRAHRKGWSVTKRADKLGETEQRVASLNGTVDNLNNLESSTQYYRLDSGAGEVGGTTYDPATGEVVISYSNAANFVHESTHAGQFVSRDIAFDNLTGNTYAQDLGDGQQRIVRNMVLNLNLYQA